MDQQRKKCDCGSVLYSVMLPRALCPLRAVSHICYNHISEGSCLPSLCILGGNSNREARHYIRSVEPVADCSRRSCLWSSADANGSSLANQNCAPHIHACADAYPDAKVLADFHRDQHTGGYGHANGCADEHTQAHRYTAPADEHTSAAAAARAANQHTAPAAHADARQAIQCRPLRHRAKLRQLMD